MILPGIILGFLIAYAIQSLINSWRSKISYPPMTTEMIRIHDEQQADWVIAEAFFSVPEFMESVNGN